ncbi:hypothetical protein JCM10207_007060 [Rhodosporidiobolus poonsookiae]
MPPPQLLQKDSEWPGWGSGAFFALACEQLSHTSGHSIKLKRTRYRQLAPFASRGDQYSFACGSPRCLFSVVFRDTETGTFAVVECALRHNHKPEPRSSEQVKRLEEKLVTLKRGIVEQAAHDLRRMHMSASYRQGYEKDERPGAMPPLLEQQLVFWDLVPVFGETAVKAFEGKMRESHSLVDNYPARSPIAAGLQPYLPSIAEDPPSTFATDLDSFVLGLFPSYSSAELNATSSVLDKAGIASVGDLVSLALMEQTSLRQVNEALKHREATADECTALAYVLRAVSSGGEERGV